MNVTTIVNLTTSVRPSLHIEATWWWLISEHVAKVLYTSISRQLIVSHTHIDVHQSVTNEILTQNVTMAQVLNTCIFNEIFNPFSL